MNKNIFEIDPNIRLSSVPLFRLTFTVLPSLALICLMVITINSNLEFDPSFSGFNFGLFIVFKVPLAILAACITILGVIAAIHKSAQTTLQIEKATEQNTFSNFYKHRQEYVDHFNEIKEQLPQHIRTNLSDKIIRGYYSSSYPFNNPSNFSIKSNLGWIESFDEELIKLAYLLSKMTSTNDVNLIVLIYKEYDRQETSIRQGLFDINRPDDAKISNDEYKKVKIHYWDGSRSELLICKSLLKSSFRRIKDYADFLTKLKYLCDQFEGTMLFGTGVYSGLSSMEYHNEFNEQLVDDLFSGDKEILEVAENEMKRASKLFEEVEKLYNRKIAALNSHSK